MIFYSNALRWEVANVKDCPIPRTVKSQYIVQANVTRHVLLGILPSPPLFERSGDLQNVFQPPRRASMYPFPFSSEQLTSRGLTCPCAAAYVPTNAHQLLTAAAAAAVATRRHPLIPSDTLWAALDSVVREGPSLGPSLSSRRRGGVGRILPTRHARMGGGWIPFRFASASATNQSPLCTFQIRPYNHMSHMSSPHLLTCRRLILEQSLRMDGETGESTRRRLQMKIQAENRRFQSSIVRSTTSSLSEQSVIDNEMLIFQTHSKFRTGPVRS